MSDDLFRCKNCLDICDKDDKNAITYTKWATKASAKVALCPTCFTNVVSNVGFKLEWKEWPKRGRRDEE